jgi:hypothetical protein
MIWEWESNIEGFEAYERTCVPSLWGLVEHMFGLVT